MRLRSFGLGNRCVFLLNFVKRDLILVAILEGWNLSVQADGWAVSGNE